jgi:hypothetical protein
MRTKKKKAEEKEKEENERRKSRNARIKKSPRRVYVYTSRTPIGQVRAGRTAVEKPAWLQHSLPDHYEDSECGLARAPAWHLDLRPAAHHDIELVQTNRKGHERDNSTRRRMTTLAATPNMPS